FDRGLYELPDGSEVGSGARGDLAAVVAAILFDASARSASAAAGERFGKLREPVVRLVNWMRAFNVRNIAPEYAGLLFDALAPSALSQHPYRSRSVFNFYRPGYVPPSTLSGSEGMTLPEFQLVNATTMPAYLNYISAFIFRETEDPDPDDPPDPQLNPAFYGAAFVAPYVEEKRLSSEPARLVEHLDELLTFGSLSDEAKGAIAETVSSLPDDEDLRAQLAVFLVMSDPEYLIQR
ncbi:MAG: DUF1800 family protein, partial [Myxococcota bacterium]